MDGSNRALQSIRADAAGRQRAPLPMRCPAQSAAVPERSVLVAGKTRSGSRMCARAARFLQQRQREKTGYFRFRQQFVEQSA